MQALPDPKRTRRNLEAALASWVDAEQKVIDVIERMEQADQRANRLRSDVARSVSARFPAMGARTSRSAS